MNIKISYQPRVGILNKLWWLLFTLISGLAFTENPSNEKLRFWSCDNFLCWMTSHIISNVPFDCSRTSLLSLVLQSIMKSSSFLSSSFLYSFFLFYSSYYRFSNDLIPSPNPLRLTFLSTDNMQNYFRLFMRSSQQ